MIFDEHALDGAYKEIQQKWRSCLVAIITTGGWMDSQRNELWRRVTQDNGVDPLLHPATCSTCGNSIQAMEGRAVNTKTNEVFCLDHIPSPPLQGHAIDTGQQ